MKLIKWVSRYLGYVSMLIVLITFAIMRESGMNMDKKVYIEILGIDFSIFSYFIIILFILGLFTTINELVIRIEELEKKLMEKKGKV